MGRLYERGVAALGLMMAVAVLTLGALAQPVITGLSPESAFAYSNGLSLTVTGEGFTEGAVVVFGDQELEPATSSETAVTVAVPAGLLERAPGTIPVIVRNGGDEPEDSAPVMFTLLPATPSISGVTPSTVDASVDPVVITLTGNHFASDAEVQLGTTALTPSSVTETSIVVEVPASALTTVGQATFHVTNPGNPNEAAASVLVAPTLSSIAPVSVVANSGAFSLEVTGAGFVSGTTLLLNGTPIPAASVGGGGTTASFPIPANLIQHAGDRTVTVSVGGVSSLPPGQVLSVTPAGELTIVGDADLGFATMGIQKEWPLSALGGTPPYQWSVVGGNPLPGGLSVNPQTGMISGTPALAGDYSFRVRVQDSSATPVVGEKSLTLRVGEFVISTQDLPLARVGAAYEAQLAHQNGPSNVAAEYTWILESGTSSLPPGLSFNTTNGVISGTPESVDDTGQTFNIQVAAQHNPTGLRTPSRVFTISVTGGGLDITVQTLPLGSVGQAYGPGGNGITIRAINGTAPYMLDFSAATLELLADIGMEVERPNATTPAAVANLRLRGTPTIGGEFTLTVVVRDSVGSEVQRQLTLVVLGSELNISPAQLPKAVINVPFEQQLALNGLTEQEQGGDNGPSITWQLSGAPQELTLSPNGLLSGTFTALGTRSFTVMASTVLRSVSRQYTLQVGASVPEITTTSLPQATVGTTYTASIQATGGTPGYTWQIAGIVLPTGLSFVAESVTSDTLQITGTPSPNAESRTFSLTVRDSANQTTSREFTLAVSSVPVPPLSIAPFENAQPAEQKDVLITLSEPYPLVLNGTATVSFTPNATNNADDPNVRFLSGSRSATFVIQPGTTAAAFPNVSPQKVQTGTVAGTIRVDAALDGMEGATTQEIVIPRSAPVILDGVTVQLTSSGFTLTLTAYSTARDLGSARVTFVPRSGSNLETTEVTIPLSSAATEWFNSDAGRGAGGAFRLSIPFTVNGGTNAVQSLTVTLTNSVGTSNARSVSF